VLCLLAVSPLSHALTVAEVKSAVGSRGSAYGQTPAYVQEDFGGVMLRQLATSNADTTLGRMNDSEFQLLVYHLDYAGVWVQARSLLNAYAPSQMGRFMSISTAAGIWTREGVMIVNLPAYYKTTLKVAVPDIGMSLTELWLEFRTAPGLAPVGELTGIAETTAYVTQYGASWLVPAGAAGYAVGSGISWSLQQFAPDWYADVLGKFEAQLLDSLEAAATQNEIESDLEISLNNILSLTDSTCIPDDLGNAPCGPTQ
jgi:hypothetical protein